MFTKSMTLIDMDKIIFNKERSEGVILTELVKMMCTSDLTTYLDTFKKEKEVFESDFIWIEKVGANAFYIASELQFRS